MDNKTTQYHLVKLIGENLHIRIQIQQFFFVPVWIFEKLTTVSTYLPTCSESLALKQHHTTRQYRNDLISNNISDRNLPFNSSSVGDLWHLGTNPDPYLWLMDSDLAPDLTPDLTPFFSDFKDTKNYFFSSYFFLITYPQAHYLQS